jgi:hypothetical protein
MPELKNRTFLVKAKDKEESLTIQFKDSTCHVYDINAFDKPWFLTTHGKSLFLSINELPILLDVDKDGNISGLNLLEGRNTQLEFIPQKTKNKLDDVLGKWYEEIDPKLPKPPARVGGNDSIWPPYYTIEKNQINHYFLGIQKSLSELDPSHQFITFKNLQNDFVGYEVYWKIIELSGDSMLIERTTKRDKFAYTYYKDTLNLRRQAFLKN